MSVEGMANHLAKTMDAAIVDDSLILCSLPPRKSVCSWDEQPRLSYYNPNEQQAVPFKWEASPGKPMAGEFQPRSPEFPVAQLRPPPGSVASRRQPRTGDEASVDEFDHVRSPASALTQQRPRLPPKNRSLGRPQMSVNMRNPSTTSGKPGHYRSNDSVSSCGRSDFDWPEVSDDDSNIPADDQEPRPAAGPTKEEFFSSSRSSFSSTSTSSPVTSRSGGSRGGSGHDLMLWRNLVNIAAASVAPPKARPVYGVESFSEEDDNDDESDHVRPGRGFLSCMPIFSRVRMIQSQMSKFQREEPAMINFSNRLTPGMRSKVYRG